MIHSRPRWRIILVLSLFFHLASSAAIPRRSAPTFAATRASFETSLGHLGGVLTLTGSSLGGEKESRAETAGYATSMSDVEFATAAFSNQGIAGPATSASQTVTEPEAGGTVQSQPSGILQPSKVGGASGGAAADPTLAVQLQAIALASILSSSNTAVFTSMTYVDPPTNGKPTTVQPIVLISASTGLVRVATSDGPAPDSDSGPSIKTAVLAGVFVGVIILLTGIIPHCLCMCRRRRRQALATSDGQISKSNFGSSDGTTALASGVIRKIIFFLAGIIPYCLCMCRRRRRQALALQQPGSPQEIPTPFVSEFESAAINRESWALYIDRLRTRQHGLSPSNTFSTRQLYISNQVNRVRQKVAELEEMSSLLLHSSRPTSLISASGTDQDPPAVTAEVDEPAHTDDPESPGVQVQLERANQQIEELNSRIRELEIQWRSSWALGLSDEPPPGYFE